MSRISRRSFLGSSGGVLGLAACSSEVAGEPQEAEPGSQPIYAGLPTFEHGVASGDPLSNAVIIWTRVTPDERLQGASVPVSFVIYTDEALSEPLMTGRVQATSASDYTIKLDIGDLEADTVYFYQFSVYTETGQIASPIGRTKTTAASGTKPVRLAVVSCSNFPFGYFHVYRDIAGATDLDAVVHLGDYIYEYGVDGYGGSTGREIDRNHEPPLEIVALEDYRLRHAQYKRDPDLQAAHAAAPWLCSWDDHESANDSYRTGAQNHNPEENEGNWSDRKQAAVQAYLEWMPVRDPEPGRARETIYRTFDFGDVASITCLESRLTGRSDEISWFTELAGVEGAAIVPVVMGAMGRVRDPERTMLGTVQEDWLAAVLAASVESGKAWQVLANQVVMARVKPPRFKQSLTEDQIAAQDVYYIQQLIEFSQLGMPWNLDAWDGFPAARDRLYAAARGAGANLVTLTGDTHTAWANTLFDEGGEQRGVEFGCTSVTSPGFGTYMKAVDDLGEQFANANDEVDWYDPHGNGWTLVTLTSEDARADYRKVSDVTQSTYTVDEVASFSTNRNGASLTPLSRA